MVRYTTPFGEPRRSSTAPRIELQFVQSAADAALGDRRAAQATTKQYTLPSPVPSLAPVSATVRKVAGLETKRPCKMCLQVFPESALKGRISFKAILEQRARWGVVNLRARDIAAGVLYESHKVCVFCSQFFDEEVMALDDALLEASALKSLGSDADLKSDHDILSRVEADVSSTPRSPSKDLGTSLRSSNRGRRLSAAGPGSPSQTAMGVPMTAAEPPSFAALDESSNKMHPTSPPKKPSPSPTKSLLEQSLSTTKHDRNLENKFALRVLEDVAKSRSRKAEAEAKRREVMRAPAGTNATLLNAMKRHTEAHERRTAALLRLRELRRSSTPNLTELTAVLRRHVPLRTF